MTASKSGGEMPPAIPAEVAWTAFNRIFRASSWRLQIARLRPIAIEVAPDEYFESDLSGASGTAIDVLARAWVAGRVVEAAESLTQTELRRLSLQIPDAPQGASADVFLEGLKRRIEFALRDELTAHFDRSINEWERDALDYMSQCRDPRERERFRAYTGFDQLVSEEAARKAVKYLAHRMPWGLQGDADELRLVPGMGFNVLTSRRDSDDEATRARSMVARAIEQIFADNSRRRLEGQNVAPVTRHSIMDAIKKRFDRDGPWGLVHLVLDDDRARYVLSQPHHDAAQSLIERQDLRLFRAWCPERIAH